MDMVSVLQTSDQLTKCGMVYHSDLGILICPACQAAILPNHIITHQKKQHQLKVMQLDLEAVLASFHVHPHSNVFTPESIQAPIEGIKIHDGFQCGQCTYVCLQASTMKTHWSTKHRHLSYIDGKDRSFPVKAQTLFGSQTGRQYFSVDCSSKEDTSSDPFSLFIKQFGCQLNLTPPTTLPTRDRDIPSLVKKLRWYEHLQVFCEDKEKRTQLLGMAVAPGTDDGPLSHLSKVTKAYFTQIKSEESQVTFQILRSL